MGRSKVRGFEWTGVKLAVEVPGNWNWAAFEEEAPEIAVRPEEADVFVGVRVAAPERPKRDVVRYQSRGVRFEVGSFAGDWVVAVSDAGGIQRSARFDREFRNGEIRVAPDALERVEHPLAHPLDELILMHRLMREGCVVVDARLQLEANGAHLFFEAQRDRAARASANALGMARPARDALLVLRPIGEREHAEQTPLWVYSTPWRATGEAAERRYVRSRVAELHLLTAEDDGALPQCASRSVSPRTATNELLRHVVVPVHDPDALDRVSEVVARVARLARVTRMDRPAMNPSLLLDWDAPEAALGFAAPGT